MLSAHRLSEDHFFQIAGSDSSAIEYNNAAIKFYEWAMRGGGLCDDELVFEHSKYLSLCNTDAKFDFPPNMFLIGKEAGGRKKFGDAWADSFRINRTSPISGLEEITAPGYLKSLSNGVFMDCIEYKDTKSFGLYNRLIIPIKMRENERPFMIGSFLIFQHYEKR